MTPDADGCLCYQLTPFVTQNMEETPRTQEKPDGTLYVPKKVDGVEFLKLWKKLNPAEYETVVDHQEEMRRLDLEREEHSAAAEETNVQAPARKRTKKRKSHSSSTSTNSPMQQQQTRQMHTSSRRLTSAQPTPIDSPPERPPLNPVLSSNEPPKEWNKMTRAERKELINTAAKTHLRTLRKSRGRKTNIETKEKKNIKFKIKMQLRSELIGSGIVTDPAAYQSIMMVEGRRRKAEGLPKWTAKEKEAFVAALTQKSYQKPADVLEKVLASMKS